MERVRIASKGRNLKIIIALVIVIPVLALVVLLANERTMRFAAAYLMVNDPLESEVLVVEGWVSDRALEEVVQRFREDSYEYILTAGGPLDPVISMYKTGFYKWKPAVSWNLEEGDSLILKLRGEVAGGILPHFRVEVNGQLVGRDSALTDWKLYTFPLLSVPGNIDSLCLFFENDGHAYPEDRNLHLAEFSIGGMKLNARTEGAAVYVGRREKYRFEESAFLLSWAESCREELMLMGIPGSKIRAVQAPATSRNRTYTSALAVAHRLQEEKCSFSRINVFSEGMHARRTWHLYRHAFRGSGVEIGILAASNFEHLSMDPSLLRKEVLKELIGNLYYRFLFNKRKLRKEVLSLDQ